MRTSEPATITVLTEGFFRVSSQCWSLWIQEQKQLVPALNEKRPKMPSTTASDFMLLHWLCEKRYKVIICTRINHWLVQQTWNQENIITIAKWTRNLLCKFASIYFSGQPSRVSQISFESINSCFRNKVRQSRKSEHIFLKTRLQCWARSNFYVDCADPMLGTSTCELLKSSDS